MAGATQQPQWGESLRSRRLALGLSLMAVAALSGTPINTISAWERGLWTPRPGAADAVEAALAASVPAVPAMAAAEIRRRRTALGMNQARLAALVGVSPAAVSAWETGAYSPSPEHSERLRAALCPEGE